MPPKCKFTREEIIQAALELTREAGIGAVTARAVGNKLHSSSKVIFSLFQNMEELQDEVIKAANMEYQSYITREMEVGEYPPYKATGMAYIRYAREEKELFRLLFMRDRSGEQISENRDEVQNIIEIIQKNTGLDQELAYLFHIETWVFVHGIASMIATDYLEFDQKIISDMMTDAYEGLKERFGRKNAEKISG